VFHALVLLPFFSLTANGVGGDGRGGVVRSINLLKSPRPNSLPLGRGEGVGGSAQLHPVIHGKIFCGCNKNEKEESGISAPDLAD